MTDKQSRVPHALPSSRRGRTGMAVIAVLGVAALLGVALALATVIGGGDTGQAAPSMSMAGMNMSGPSEGTAYWHHVAGAGFKSDGKVRTYYLSADEVVWDYAPDGRNEITGEPFDEVADT